MKTDELRWESFERSALPRALFGSCAGGVRGRRVENALETGHGIGLGYTRGERRAYCPPALIVIEEKAAAETLSWLKTFAPETSPLSQFARIVSRSDWEKFGAGAARAATSPNREDRWACVILGELLAQGESDADVRALPLSWSASCFSTAVGRTSIIHSSDEAVRTCIERLISLEKDPKFARRPVPINVLEPVWSVAYSATEEALGIKEAVDFIFTATNRLGDGPSGLKARASALLSTENELLSDSVENRVLAFQRLVPQVMDEAREGSSTALASAIIAAGAFLVGRGTSHGFLLGRLPKRWAHAFSWFGLMAGLAGPHSWDGDWSRAAKGMERSLQGPFDWSISTADLCWIEYSWLTNMFAGSEVFAELPKMLPKVLSVEIVPGATCQMRFVADGRPRAGERGDHAEAEQSDRELRSTLEQLASLALRAQHLLRGRNPQRFQEQGELRFDDDAQERESRGPKKNRPNPRGFKD